MKTHIWMKVTKKKINNFKHDLVLFSPFSQWCSEISKQAWEKVLYRKEYNTVKILLHLRNHIGLSLRIYTRYSRQPALTVLVLTNMVQKKTQTNPKPAVKTIAIPPTAHSTNKHKRINISVEGGKCKSEVWKLISKGSKKISVFLKWKIEM